MDTVRGKNAHDALIQQFEQERIDILGGHTNGGKRVDSTMWIWWVSWMQMACFILLISG